MALWGNKTGKEKSPEEIILKIFDDNLNPYHKLMEKIWFRNILYYIGEQYLEYVVSSTSFRRKPTHPLIPTPVSNIIRDYVRSMKALILNKEFAIRVFPNSNEKEDREASLMGQDVLAHMDTLNDEEFLEEKEKVALWMLLVGTAFMRTFPMKDSGDFQLNKSKTNFVTTGEVVSENIMSFNVHVDNLGDSLDKKSYVAIKSLKPREWVEDIFKTTLKAGDSNPSIINYQARLMKLLGEVSPWKLSGLESQISNFKEEDLVIFKEVEFRPTAKYPDGRYLVECDGKILLDMRSMPIPKENNKWYYTLTDFHYNYVPGRFWSDAGVNDIISPQDQINQIDQDMAINRKGLGQPFVLTPSDVQLKRLDKWGQVLKVIQYDSNSVKEPKVERGTPLPNQFLDARAIHRAAAQDAAGDPKNILGGSVPTAKASGIMVDILRETAESSHGPDINRFYRSLKRVYKKRLVLAQILYTEERLIKISGKGTAIRVTKFKAADLRGNTDVRLELASGTTSTEAGKTNMITNLLQTGQFFGDLSQDPDTRQEILRRLGLGGFENKTSVDVERAEEENLRIMAAQESDSGEKILGIFLADVNSETGEQEVVNDDPLFKHDNHLVHYEIHRRLIMAKEFKVLPEKAKTIMLAHADIHQQLYQQEQQAQLKQQIMMERAMKGIGEKNQEAAGEG